MLSHAAFCFIRDLTFPILPRYNKHQLRVGEWSSRAVLYLCFWGYVVLVYLPLLSPPPPSACAIGIILIVNTLEGTFSSPAFLSR